MLKSLRLRAIFASVLVLACAREALGVVSAADYGSLFNDRAEITFPHAPYKTAPLYDYPLLVQLSTNALPGFSYARVDPQGQDLRFVFVEGTSSNAVPYEVDAWNTNGVSTLWVRVPSYSNAAGLKLVMYWAPDDPDALPTNSARTVWNGYTGVWHLNDAADSAPTAIASAKGSKATARAGRIGGALGTRDSGANGPILQIPSGTPVDALTTNAYTITAWLNVNSIAGDPWLYSARRTQDEDAFGVKLVEESGEVKLQLYADAETVYKPKKTLSPGEWVHLAIVHSASNGVHRLFVNGCEPVDSSARADKPGAGGFAFGGLVGATASGTLNGDLDDVRIYPGVRTKGWFTNEYAQAVSPSYLAFSNFHTTGKPVYVDEEEDPEPEDDPTPSSPGTAAPDDYAGSAKFTPSGVSAGVVLTNFVTLIQVLEGSPEGFYPKKLPFGSEDIRFFDQDGHVLNYDLECWDENATSYFWVKIPQLSSETIITMCWGLKAGRTLPANDTAEVWSDYAGVWHMSDERDSTTNAAAGVFGPSAVTNKYGLVGRAFGTTKSGRNGAILDIETNEALDSLTNATFTVSGWVWLNRAAVKYGALFSRAATNDAAWGAQFCGGTSGNNSKIEMQAGSSSVQADVEVAPLDWVRFDFVYSPDRLAFYIDGEKKCESTGARTILNGSSGQLSIGGFVPETEDVLGANTLDGYIDEFRIRPGVLSDAEMKADSLQCTDEDFHTPQPAVWDDTATLQNRWKTYPTASKTEWNEGEDPAEFTLGTPWYGTSELQYQNRSTGEILAEMPTVAGDYRAVFTVAAVDRYSELTHSISFRIRMYRPTHDLGNANDRILLLNSDQSVSDGKVYVQAYDDTAQESGRPYWVHDGDTGTDYTSTSYYYNFCGGKRHTYYARGEEGEDRKRLWDLIDVRYGNTYNNAEWVYEEYGAYEEWDEGLWEDQNYLPWNPAGGRLIDEGGQLAEGWHEYAAQAVMCNTLKASINSCLYTNGIGTIYFDCVNSHTDDATNGCYKLVVEIATNALTRMENPADRKPYGIPTDEAIAASYQKYDEESGTLVDVVYDSYKYADWKPLEMHVRLVHGSEMTDLGTTDELVLDETAGGSYTNFYRVYIPVNFTGNARFRIRRTAVNPDYTILSDLNSMILVDNVICSCPSEHVVIMPRGFYDTTKVKRELIGYEGAFRPSYPSVHDKTVYARARATDSAGNDIPSDFLSSVAMHYRWRYLDQQATDWATVDLNPATLESIDPISWPMCSGDLEYWYEANQSGEFYQYADYSGAGLGLPGYSEEVTSVEGRAPTYKTHGIDWFTRIRDGKSTYGTVKLYVRTAADKTNEVEMFVARDGVWRGCLLATNAVSYGIDFRFEMRNHQDDSLPNFQFNTNCWYLSRTAESLPVSDWVVAGTANDWGHVPCDGATGHVLFQLDESTRAIVVVHADWQDFNGWNDAHRDYFSGSSIDNVTKRGTSSLQREYSCSTNRWDDDCATNAFWNERFWFPSYEAVNFYEPFLTEESPNGFGVGEGMWVRGAYADTSDISGMALQMAGQGRGHIRLSDPTVRPRGIESVRFSARIAQMVSPDDFAYSQGSPTQNVLFLEDYTFLARVAFDQNANSNFTGNASLSLAAFYRPNTCCYEARWEQLEGNVDKDSGEILGPVERGQRLALYRWQYDSREWKATELYAATNSARVTAGNIWKSAYAPRAIPQAHSITNGLMPFMIGAYNNDDEKYTVVVAAVHIPGVADAAKNRVGNTAAATLTYLGNESGWLYVVYRDTSANRLTRGTYGVLAANCEGVFVRPQLHEGLVSWQDQAATRTLSTQIWPGSKATRSEFAKFYASASAYDCVRDIAEDYWTVPSGRMRSFYGMDSSGYTVYNGLSYETITQTVEILTAPYGTENWTNVASRTLTGFGKPGVLQDMKLDVWGADDRAVKIQSGGSIRTIRTDVVVDNIEIRQWRGKEWSAATSDAEPTNFVYTYGWVDNGVLQLSPRRTPDGCPCSLRTPLCDGAGSGDAKRGKGLGSLMIEYRNAQSNACLCVQIATNGINALTLGDRTLDPGDDELKWTTVTNWDFSIMKPEARATGKLWCSLGLHGISGTMRVIVDPTLRAKVKDLDDPTAFGSVEIVEALFKDEPSLDNGCWWGFNIRTIGDVSDTEKRMYLPDNPMRRIQPPLDEYGMSLALNNSITDQCDTNETAKVPNPFRDHMPFLQTPTFSSNIVGEVSFKARKYALEKGSQPAEITLYGTTAKDLDTLQDEDWEELKIFGVSNTTYETYTYKTDASAAYRAFRFAVTGVDGVTPYPGHDPTQGGDKPVRVLLDDVLVSEAIRARLAFRNVGAFRHKISETVAVPNVPSVTEQPICGEGWGVQAEVYSAMLGDEVDQSVTPKVRLHYYKGVSPWGYSQWKSKSSAVSAWMTAATDTTNVFRSSAIDSPKAVVPMSSSTEVVQYTLEVVYNVINSETGRSSETTNWLESADWSVPAWYYPVDYNALYGGGNANKFAAFSIIDTIAPGWAWINEINLYAPKAGSFDNADAKKQFVEVVKPVDYDLDGWELRMLSAKSYGTSQASFLTNTVAVFGRDVPKQKAGGASCNYMSFIVVGNPTTTLTGTQYDGKWRFAETDNRVFESGGVLGHYYPVAIQLVRPLGVIEHEVALLGTNAFESVAAAIAWQYSSTNMVRLIQANDPKSKAFALPDDCTAAETSVGVFAEKGETALCWNNTMTMTPGDLNVNQTIDPQYPRPGGELIMVFAYVDTVFGRIRQTVGAGTNTTEMQTVTIDRDSKKGVDITYNVSPWCELKIENVKETEDGKARIPILVSESKSNRVYTVNVAKEATGNVTVLATASVDSRLRGYGLDANNRYTPAVLHWLEGGRTLDGEFYGYQGGETNDTIYLAQFLALSGEVVTNMTLTQMYWLDMDPTASNMFFRAGMVKPPSPVVWKDPTYDPDHDSKAYTNLRMGVYMSISNGNGHATHRGKSVWAPYVLRGLGNDELSWNYSPDASSEGAWTSETFKVTGYLNTGLTSPSHEDVWIPLRYFVFKDGSFDANFESEIDILDPFSTASPAYAEGWKRYVDEHGGKKPSVFLGWNIDTRLKPITAEILAPTNRLDAAATP